MVNKWLDLLLADSVLLLLECSLLDQRMVGMYLLGSVYRNAGQSDFGTCQLHIPDIQFGHRLAGTVRRPHQYMMNHYDTDRQHMSLGQ